MSENKITFKIGFFILIFLSTLPLKLYADTESNLKALLEIVKATDPKIDQTNRDSHSSPVRLTDDTTTEKAEKNGDNGEKLPVDPKANN